MDFLVPNKSQLRQDCFFQLEIKFISPAIHHEMNCTREGVHLGMICTAAGTCWLYFSPFSLYKMSMSVPLAFSILDEDVRCRIASCLLATERDLERMPV